LGIKIYFGKDFVFLGNYFEKYLFTKRFCFFLGIYLEDEKFCFAKKEIITDGKKYLLRDKKNLGSM
jgi:hypothetical protein